jgi:hypothetical protein
MFLEVEQHWTPSKPRENDIFLVEYAMPLNLSISHLKMINQCRLHLQVITLSYITSADGKHISPSILFDFSSDRGSLLE